MSLLTNHCLNKKLGFPESFNKYNVNNKKLGFPKSFNIYNVNKTLTFAWSFNRFYSSSLSDFPYLQAFSRNTVLDIIFWTCTEFQFIFYWLKRKFLVFSNFQIFSIKNSIYKKVSIKIAQYKKVPSEFARQFRTCSLRNLASVRKSRS